MNAFCFEALSHNYSAFPAQSQKERSTIDSWK
jgi:hypothetical protein